jgi:hypothetical protein
MKNKTEIKDTARKNRKHNPALSIITSNVQDFPQKKQYDYDALVKEFRKQNPSICVTVKTRFSKHFGGSVI